MTYYAVGHFDTCESFARVSKNINCKGSRFSRLCSYGQTIQRDVIGLNTDDVCILAARGDDVDCAFRRVIGSGVGGVTKACHRPASCVFTVLDALDNDRL